LDKVLYKDLSSEQVRLLGMSDDPEIRAVITDRIKGTDSVSDEQALQIWSWMTSAVKQKLNLCLYGQPSDPVKLKRAIAEIFGKIIS
jgi:hypothetical protein